MPNILSGFAFIHKDELLDFLYRGDTPELLEEWKAIQDRAVSSSPENFLYYILKKYQQSAHGKHLVSAQLEWEKRVGNQTDIQ